MPRRVIREVEDVDLPASSIPEFSGNCPDGKILNAQTNKCVDSDTGNADKRSVPATVLNASSDSGQETHRRYNVSSGRGRPLPNLSYGRSGSNADRLSEARRNALYHARIQKAETSGSRALEAQAQRINAKKLRVEEMRIDAEILRARESAIPKLNVMPAKGTFANGRVSAVEAEVSKPSAWLRAVQRHQNVSPAYLWTINKEKIFENYQKKGIRSFDSNDNEIITQIKGSEADLTSVSGPPTADFMRIMSEQVLVLPSGKVVTPIRQFCETKVLPAGTKEAFFFDFGSVTFADIVEADDAIATATPSSSPIIRSAGTETNPRGTRITIGYQQTEESPIDIIASANRAFALESINDESKQVLTAFNTDTAGSGSSTVRKAIGAGVKTGRWVDGNSGAQITTDSTGLGVLKYQGLLNAKGVIQDEGLDDSNLITYTSGKAIRDLTLDADLDSYIGFSRPAIITEATIERIAGTNLVRSSAISSASQSGAKRSVMFIPNVAFGLVSGRDLTMEAQRRNELQAIHITGTQKIAGLVKNVEATCRLSHL